MSKKSKTNKTISQVNLDQFCFLQSEFEMYNQAVLVINGYMLTDENVAYDNIKQFFEKRVYPDNLSESKNIFTPTQEAYIKDVFRQCLDKVTAGFVFRFTEDYECIICIVVFPEMYNPSLDQITVNRYLVHEIVHCANRILDYCGVKLPSVLNDSEDEVHCLMVDYLYSKIANMFIVKNFAKT
jgi:hypothetical protein